jgi:hypothetical protein
MSNSGEIRSINEQLARGELPVEFQCLFNSNKPQDEQVIDWDKVVYNSFIREHEVAARFTCGYDHITGFDRVISAIAEQASQKTLLEEMTERQALAQLLSPDSNNTQPTNHTKDTH